MLRWYYERPDLVEIGGIVIGACVLAALFVIINIV